MKARRGALFNGLLLLRAGVVEDNKKKGVSSQCGWGSVATDSFQLTAPLAPRQLGVVQGSLTVR